jgi:hypothetical protein
LEKSGNAIAILPVDDDNDMEAETERVDTYRPHEERKRCGKKPI